MDVQKVHLEDTGGNRQKETPERSMFKIATSYLQAAERQGK